MQKNIFGIYLGGRDKIKYLREKQKNQVFEKIKNQLLREIAEGQIFGKEGKH